MQSEDGTGIERAALPDGLCWPRSSLARKGPKQPCYDGSWTGNVGTWGRCCSCEQAVAYRLTADIRSRLRAAGQDWAPDDRCCRNPPFTLDPCDWPLYFGTCRSFSSKPLTISPMQAASQWQLPRVANGDYPTLTGQVSLRFVDLEADFAAQADSMAR